MMIREDAKELPVARKVEVIVAGGGIAGVAAVLASARSGAKTLLLEKECALGGLATLGLVVMYLPLCDGYGHQVIGGISEELLRESTRLGNLHMHAPWNCVPDCWQKIASVEERAKTRYRVDFDAAPMMLTLERILLAADVEIWYDTRLCAAIQEGGELRYLIVENKSGRLGLEAKSFVDATGDADLCFLSGEETISATENRRSGWYFSARDSGAIHLYSHTDPLQGPCPKGSRFYRGDSGSEVSHYIQDMHAYIAENAQRNPHEVPFLIPTLPLMRMTRRLVGQEDLSIEQLGCWKDDVIAMTGDWRKPAPVYSIGLRNIRGRRVANLFAAGRCIGAQGDAWDVTRVIPTCGATGQAAGTAAAMLANAGHLEVTDLQRQLKKDGVILDKSLANR